MNCIGKIRRSIGMTQATAVLVASLFFALFSSSMFLGYNLSKLRQDAAYHIADILTAAEGGASMAAWTLDSSAANQVVTSVMDLHQISAVELRDDSGEVLAHAISSEGNQNHRIQQLTAKIVGENIVGERLLTVSIHDESRSVGTLSVELSSAKIADDFLTFALLVFLVGVIQSVSIAILLLWLSSRLVTSPLRQVTKSIENIDPENPETIDSAHFSKHRKNEFGYLIKHTNEMLMRLANTQKQLRSLATTDPLTNTPNRTLISDRLAKAMSNAERQPGRVAVMYLDLDRFKNINDSLGHNVGDELLIEATRRLSCVLRTNDSIGRMGGDEFLIVLEDIHLTDEAAVAAQRITAALKDPFEIRNHTIRTSCSVGISIYPDDGTDVVSLMRNADLAMYAAKEGSTGWEFFTNEMSQSVNLRIETESALATALERNEFSLHYQPKFHANSQTLSGCEALLRWDNAPGGMSTAEFVRIAEDSGMIISIGAWVFEQACQQANIWSQSYGPVPVSINVSARQLQEPGFTEWVSATIAHCQVDPALIELEITETVLLDTLDISVGVLTELRGMGMKVSIDDFGTGYSSLSYLTQLPIDTLKIDRALVSGEKSSKAILKMIVAMASTLQLHTVAEGVETEAQRDLLVSYNCGYLQGYLFSKPLPAERFESDFLLPTAVHKLKLVEST